MELYILLSVTLSVTLFIVALILFLKNKNQNTQLKNFEYTINRLNAENQQQEIELAKLHERLSNLSIVESKLIVGLVLRYQFLMLDFQSLLFLSHLLALLI